MSNKKKTTSKTDEIIDELFETPKAPVSKGRSNSKILVLGLAVAVLAGLIAGIVGVAVVLSGSLSSAPVFDLFSLESVLPDQQIIVRRQQSVTVTLEEQLSNVATQAAPTVVSFADKLDSVTETEEIYTNLDIIGSGIILTSDGWLAANQGLFKNKKKDEIVVLYDNDTIFEIEEIVTDKITGIDFVKINAANLLVSRLAEDWELTSSKRLATLTYSYPSTQLVVSEVAAIRYNEQDALLNSDTSIRSVLLNNILKQPYQPIFNLAGEIVGLGGIVADDGSSTLVLASNFMPIFESFLHDNKINRPRLGVEWINLHGNPGLNEVVRKERNKGAYVSKLLSKSPAAEVGIKVGDVITGLNDQELNGRQHLTDLVQKHSPEDIIYLNIVRNGETLEFAVELGTLTE